MYESQSWSLTDDQIAALKALVAKVDIAPGSGGSRITPIGEERMSALTSLLQIGGIGSASVVALYPSAQIIAHEDPPLRSTWNARPLTRHHIPLEVNHGCWVFHGGTWQQLLVGSVYAMDVTVTHGAVNWGATLRLHLMVDVEG